MHRRKHLPPPAWSLAATKSAGSSFAACMPGLYGCGLKSNVYITHMLVAMRLRVGGRALNRAMHCALLTWQLQTLPTAALPSQRNSPNCCPLATNFSNLACMPLGASCFFTRRINTHVSGGNKPGGWNSAHEADPRECVLFVKSLCSMRIC